MTDPSERRIGPLFTDLYELTMAAAYYEQGISSPAVFTLYIRGCPGSRRYYVAAGLQDALRELEGFRFAEDELKYLKQTGLFKETFLSYLRGLRFTGDICGMPEGTIFFENEPVLEVEAPLIEAQIIETYLINTIGFQTLVASKAARCVYAAEGRPIIDFSLRRTQGQDAGVKAARSAYLSGFAATSNVLAGKMYGIPISGTMAHSYVTAFGREEDAFSAYAKLFPKNAIFLIDTYDTLEGARCAARVAARMKERGDSLIGVRLDSGDMVELSRSVRAILDDAGLEDVQIFASSGFDEYQIADVISRGAAIDAFGVGTKLGVSADAPYLDIVYKLARLGNRDVRKLSPEKVTLAGKKQVFRRTDTSLQYMADVIGCRDESVPEGTPLLSPKMVRGKAAGSSPSLSSIREAFSGNFADLPGKYKTLDSNAASYPIAVSRQLEALQRGVRVV